MPWIDVEKCSGCGICVARCPVDTIAMEKEKANINMDGCIRCGTCHDVCPEEAVKHDAEKTPGDVKNNVEFTKHCMDACAKHLNDEREQDKCLNRIVKHFQREKLVAEKTLEELVKLKG
ncbi:4Fe-4S binding protein [bacterium]|nr:4Fe-4S binding protein [bacterium]